MRTQPQTYRFGEYTLEPAEHRLLRAMGEVALRPKAFDTLLFLVSRHGHTVTRGELLDAVWPGTFVSDAVLTHCIAEVRQALEDDVQAPRYLKTIPKVGYAFVAQVQCSSPGPSAGPFLREVPRHPTASAIAVLPFANLSSDPENEHFCDGLSEELINGLTKVPELRVVAHSSSFSFKGRDTEVQDIGRQLGVGWVLEGSVRKAGERLRISAQLIDAASGFHVWCEQYDRALSDVFALQEEIARSVLPALEVELLKSARQPLFKPSTESMEAYLLYLQGRSFWHQRFAGQLQRAMKCFEQAIQRDPRFALAYTGLADSFGSLGVWGFVPPHDAFPRAMALSRQSLALDAALAEAHASLALIHMFYDWDWAGAERELTRALELNPGHALTHLWAGHFLSIVGRLDEALAEVLHAQALDPLSPILNANVGWTFHLAGQQDRAIDELQRLLARFPGNPMALLYLGFAYVAVGKLEEALTSLRTASGSSGGTPWASESVGCVLGLAGDTGGAQAILESSLARMRTTYIPSSAIACIYLGLGEDGAMFEWLERAADERDALMPWLGFMPAFDRVRPDPRFRALLARIGLE